MMALPEESTISPRVALMVWVYSWVETRFAV